jgi:hypothetical protein
MRIAELEVGRDSRGHKALCLAKNFTDEQRRNTGRALYMTDK